MDTSVNRRLFLDGNAATLSRGGHREMRQKPHRGHRLARTVVGTGGAHQMNRVNSRNEPVVMVTAL